MEPTYEELQEMAEMPSNTATDPEIPNQDPVAEMGDEDGDC